MPLTHSKSFKEIQVEPGPQDGTLLVTWQPVSRPPAGASGPVTGYAVYADGKKVTDVDSPTGDHALIDITKLVGINPQAVTVRTKSRDAQSGDSMATPIPRESSFSPFSFTLYTILSVNSLLSLSSSVKTLFSITIPLIVFHLIIIETHL